MICPNCGVLLPENVTTCGNCGFDLNAAPEINRTIVEDEDGGKVKFDKTVVDQPQDLQQTVIFSGAEEKPPFGWLVITEGPGQWREFRLPQEEGQYHIGSDSSCTITISDPSVARFHASLRIKEGKLFITDLDTDTGTFLNDKPVIREEVPDGAEIRIGDVRLKFRRF